MAIHSNNYWAKAIANGAANVTKSTNEWLRIKAGGTTVKSTNEWLRILAVGTGVHTNNYWLKKISGLDITEPTKTHSDNYYLEYIKTNNLLP